jgi:hypothetical protein
MQKCTPVLVIGIGLRYLSSTFITLDLYFRGADNAAYIPIEAYLVENLKAKLLISIDVMGHKGFRLDFDAKTVKILSYINLTVPISTYTVIQDGGKRCMRFYSSTDVELNTWRTGRSGVTCTEVASRP